MFGKHTLPEIELERGEQEEEYGLCVCVCGDVRAACSHWRVSGEDMRLGSIQSDWVSAGSFLTSPSGSLKMFPFF